MQAFPEYHGFRTLSDVSIVDESEKTIAAHKVNKREIVAGT